ncbi:MAG: formylglycine-generating enzyme family protein [Magnetococcales bacterium]|nr:formylglycine-generating enzyme family protein [Magnetococcales bacterium]
MGIDPMRRGYSIGFVSLFSVVLLAILSIFNGVEAANRQVKKLLPVCQDLLSRNALTLPTGDRNAPPKNAMDCFRRVQELDFTNRTAEQGLAIIEKRYEKMAENAINAGDEAKAKLYINRLKSVNYEGLIAEMLERKLLGKKEQEQKKEQERLQEIQAAKQRKIALAQQKAQLDKQRQLDLANAAKLKLAAIEAKRLLALKKQEEQKLLAMKEMQKKKKKVSGFPVRDPFELESEYQQRVKDFLRKVNDNMGVEGYEVADVVLDSRLYDPEKGVFPIKLDAKPWAVDLLKEVNKPYFVLSRDEARKLFKRGTRHKVYAKLDSANLLHGLFLFSEQNSFKVKSVAEGGKLDWQEPVTGMLFVWVPNGCFKMGSNTGNSDERPVHEVCITKGFWMSKYEVTNKQFRKYKPDHDSKVLGGASLNGDNLPAVQVSWNKATSFAQWLSSHGNGKFRLPTEAEWEYAARAGTTSERYWGDGEKEACRFGNVSNPQKSSSFFIPDPVTFPCNDNYKVTAPVGSFRPNQFGLHDMMGNVWEWVHDKYRKNFYEDSPRNDPLGPSLSQYRVIRGGDWKVKPSGVRSANRDKDTPGFNNGYLGVRLLREP